MLIYNKWSRAISIHALQAECDLVIMLFIMAVMVFLSTHSKRSATITVTARSGSDTISIHALQAECDNGAKYKIPRYYHFYPRTPSGVRLLPSRHGAALIQFLSTHSKRSATMELNIRYLAIIISIHALQAECDRFSLGLTPPFSNFYPRTPSGVRLQLALLVVYHNDFYPRTPSGVRLPF